MRHYDTHHPVGAADHSGPSRSAIGKTFCFWNGQRLQKDTGARPCVLLNCDLREGLLRDQLKNRYRKVTISLRLQMRFGENVSSLVPYASR